MRDETPIAIYAIVWMLSLVYNVCVIFTSPTNHFEACSTDGYGARKTMDPADVSGEEESEPEMEPVESENSSTTNPNVSKLQGLKLVQRTNSFL